MILGVGLLPPIPPGCLLRASLTPFQLLMFGWVRSKKVTRDPGHQTVRTPQEGGETMATYDENVYDHGPGTTSSIPDLTGLQYLVLTAIVREPEVSGRDLRAWLANNGVKSSGPQFYQMMARLEGNHYVEGHYHQKEIEHQIVNERRYRILERGRGAWQRTGDFYLSLRQRAAKSKSQTANPRTCTPRKELVNA